MEELKRANKMNIFSGSCFWLLPVLWTRCLSVNLVCVCGKFLRHATMKPRKIYTGKHFGNSFLSFQSLRISTELGLVWHRVISINTHDECKGLFKVYFTRPEWSVIKLKKCLASNLLLVYLLLYNKPRWTFSKYANSIIFVRSFRKNSLDSC